VSISADAPPPEGGYTEWGCAVAVLCNAHLTHPSLSFLRHGTRIRGTTPACHYVLGRGPHQACAPRGYSKLCPPTKRQGHWQGRVRDRPCLHAHCFRRLVSPACSLAPGRQGAGARPIGLPAHPSPLAKGRSHRLPRVRLAREALPRRSHHRRPFEASWPQLARPVSHRRPEERTRRCSRDLPARRRHFHIDRVIAHRRRATRCRVRRFDFAGETGRTELPKRWYRALSTMRREATDIIIDHSCFAHVNARFFVASNLGARCRIFGWRRVQGVGR